MLKPLPPRPARGTTVARGLILFALVVMVQAVLARRFDLIDTVTLYATLAAVAVIALIGLAVTTFSLLDVWRDAAPGFGSAFGSLMLGVMVLAPFAGAGAAIAVYPNLSEVSTDLTQRPEFRVRPAAMEPLLAGSATGDEAARLQQAAYPDIVPRRLSLSTVEAHALARTAATELGWRILAEEEPVAEGDPGMIETEARTLVLAVPEDAVIRIWPDPSGSRVDVRSASRLPIHDLGENARRIRGFYAKLDEILTRPAD